MSCAKKKNKGEKGELFGTTHMLINSHLVAVEERGKCLEFDCFEV